MSKQLNKTKIAKEAMISALEANLGVVTISANACGVSRKTHYMWLHKDDEYKEEVESIRGIAIDFVETKLFNRIKNDDTTSIIFYLKTQGRTRGYVERQEMDIEGSLSLTVEFVDPDEEHI